MSDSLVYVYVYGAKSRVHVAFLHDGNVLTNERCNLDDLAADEREIVDSLDVIDGRELCHRCFPPVSVEVQGTGESETA